MVKQWIYKENTNSLQEKLGEKHIQLKRQPTIKQQEKHFNDEKSSWTKNYHKRKISLHSKHYQKRSPIIFYKIAYSQYLRAHNQLNGDTYL